MKKQVGIVCLIVMIVLSAAITSSAQTTIVDSMEFQGQGVELTLDNAIEIMLNDNSVVNQAKLDLDQAQLQYTQKTRDIRKEKKFDGDTVRYYGNKDPESGDYLQYYLLPHLDAEYSKASTQRTYDAKIAGLKSSLKQSYFELQQAQEMKSIYEESMDLSKDLYEKTKTKFDLGLVSKQEVLNSELNYIKAQNDYNNEVNSFKSAKMAFNILMGYDVMAEVKLKDQLTYNEVKLDSIAAAVNNALNNRDDIKAVEYAGEVAEINFKVTSKLYPDITYAYKEAKINAEKAQRTVSDTRKTVEMEVRNNYMAITQKQQEIISGQKSVELAQESLKLSQMQYDAGMAVQTDVQNAQVALQQAKAGLSKAILDYDLAVLKYQDSISVGRK